MSFLFAFYVYLYRNDIYQIDMTRNIILAFLKSKELTVYDIKKGMEKSIAYFHSSSLGSINPTIKKLEAEGLVVCNEAVENHRVKKYYKITEEGISEYEKWQNEPIKVGRIKEEALVRLFFMGDADKKKRIELIRGYMDEITGIRNNLIEEKKRVDEITIPDEFIDKAKFQKATLDFGIDYYQFTYQWFEKLLKNE